MQLELVRAYDFDPASPGYSVLVDRLWPRGIRKEDLRVDEWNRQITPSTELRKWFGHDPARWEGFRRRYLQELATQAGELARLRAIALKQPLTLVYAARDTSHNHARVLADVIEDPALVHRSR